MAGGDYRVLATARFQRDPQGLDFKIQDRILRSISSKLAPDPLEFGRKLYGVNVGEGQWKFRVGDYRIRFDIEGRDVVLHRVAHRSEIYK